MSVPQLAGDEPRTANNIPLVDGIPNLKDANAVALIVALADIIEARCVRTITQPATRAEAA